LCPKLITYMNSLQEVIDFIESTVDSLTDLHTISRRLSPQNIEGISDEDREKVVLEYEGLSFCISEGELRPIFSQSSADGILVHSFPNFVKFNKSTNDYYSERANRTSNVYLRAKYYVILWNAPKPFKRMENGKNSVDTLLSILVGELGIGRQNWLDSLTIFELAANISAQVELHQADKIREVAQHLLTLKFEDDRIFKVRLIKFMFSCTKIWKSISFEEHNLLLSIMGEFIDRPTIIWNEEAGLLGVKIANKLKIDQKIWFNKLGESCESFADFRMDDETRMIPLGQLQKAMAYYKKAGNKEKLNQVGIKFQNLKGELKLGTVRIPIKDETAEYLWKYNEKLSDRVAAYESDQIFDYLSMASDIFPKVSNFKNYRQPSFMDFAKRHSFDINKNLASLDPTEEEREREALSMQYRIYIGLQVLPLVSMIFTKGILNGKINHQTLIEYLANNSWLGQELEEINSSGETRKYWWLGLLAPAILEYFSQKEASLKSLNVFTNYVLCTDSLTLKFEGILRDFAKRVGANTIKLGRSDQIREGFTEDLLELEEIKRHFSEDDILYFKFVFTSFGENLRNNIAHCFFRFSNYEETYFLLVLTAILRFAKYRVGN
jgi:Domain of unknown function (DUF4209)